MKTSFWNVNLRKFSWWFSSNSGARRKPHFQIFHTKHFCALWKKKRTTEKFGRGTIRFASQRKTQNQKNKTSVRFETLRNANIFLKFEHFGTSPHLRKHCSQMFTKPAILRHAIYFSRQEKKPPYRSSENIPTGKKPLGFVNVGFARVFLKFKIPIFLKFQLFLKFTIPTNERTFEKFKVWKNNSREKI